MHHGDAAGERRRGWEERAGSILRITHASSVNALCVWWRTCQTRTPYWDVDHRTGFERGVRRTGPSIISTRIIIDDRPLRRPGAARRGSRSVFRWNPIVSGRILRPDGCGRDEEGEEAEIGPFWRLLFIDGDWFRALPVLEIAIDRHRSNRERRAILDQSERTGRSVMIRALTK